MQFKLTHGLDEGRFAKCIAVIFALIALSVFCLEASDLKNKISLAKHQAEVSNLRANMIETWVKQQVLPREYMFINVDGMNPMRLMATPPEHYMGEYANAPAYASNAWYFDLKERRLVYVFENGVQETYRMTATRDALGNSGRWDLIKE